MATIQQRGEKWLVRVRKKGARPICRTFTRREDAENFAQAAEIEIETGDYREGKEEARKTTLAAAAVGFAKEHLAKQKDAKRATARLFALIDRAGWGSVTLPLLRARDVAKYVEDREKSGCRPDTIRLDLAVISRLYKHARQMWDMETLKNPVDAVRRPSLRGTARQRRLEPGELQRLLAAARPDFRPVVLFALASAMRREEIATLTWANVDLDKRVAFLEKTKNGEARTVPLSSAALAIIEAEKESRPSTSSNEDMNITIFELTKDQITDRMRSACRRAGLRDLRFHDLRHEATSRLFELGTLDSFEISAITGHKTLLMLNRYTHLRAENLAKKLG